MSEKLVCFLSRSQSLDISRQENKITSNRISEVHEQEESCSINKHDILDDSEDQDDKVSETEGQDTDGDYEVNVPNTRALKEYHTDNKPFDRGKGEKNISEKELSELAQAKFADLNLPEIY